MKTAEEIAERSLRYYREKDHEDIEGLVSMIKEYAKQKCKEQRELCQEEFGKGNPKVRHAPEPEFD